MRGIEGNEVGYVCSETDVFSVGSDNGIIQSYYGKSNRYINNMVYIIPYWFKIATKIFEKAIFYKGSRAFLLWKIRVKKFGFEGWIELFKN